MLSSFKVVIKLRFAEVSKKFKFIHIQTLDERFSKIETNREEKIALLVKLH